MTASREMASGTATALIPNAGAIYQRLGSAVHGWIMNRTCGLGGLRKHAETG
jgi:hypothetical protein